AAGRSERRGNRQRWCTALAAVREARGDLDGALDLLVEAERLEVRNPIPRVRPVAAQKARLWIRQGRLAEATGWVRERGLSAHDDLSYLRAFEHVTLARVLMARSAADGDARALHEAVRLLERLTTAEEEGGRTPGVIETLALQALARQALGDLPAALASLERALALA